MHIGCAIPMAFGLRWWGALVSWLENYLWGTTSFSEAPWSGWFVTFSTSRLLRGMGACLTAVPCIHRPGKLCTPVRCILSLNNGHVHPILVLLSCRLCGRGISSVLPRTTNVRACRGCALLRSSLVSYTSVHEGGPAIRGI